MPHVQVHCKCLHCMQCKLSCMIVLKFIFTASFCRVEMSFRPKRWCAPMLLHCVQMAEHRTIYLANAVSLAVSMFVSNVYDINIIPFPCTLLFSAVYSSQFFVEASTSQPGTDRESFIPKPVGNTWSEWSSWTECSKSCAEGRQSRMRNCITEGQSVLDCSGKRVDIRVCNEHPCPGENEVTLNNTIVFLLISQIPIS